MAAARFTMPHRDCTVGLCCGIGTASTTRIASRSRCESVMVWLAQVRAAMEQLVELRMPTCAKLCPVGHPRARSVEGWHPSGAIGCSGQQRVAARVRERVRPPVGALRLRTRCATLRYRPRTRRATLRSRPRTRCATLRSRPHTLCKLAAALVEIQACAVSIVAAFGMCCVARPDVNLAISALTGENGGMSARGDERTRDQAVVAARGFGTCSQHRHVCQRAAGKRSRATAQPDARLSACVSTTGAVRRGTGGHASCMFFATFCGPQPSRRAAVALQTRHTSRRRATTAIAHSHARSRVPRKCALTRAVRGANVRRARGRARTPRAE